MKRSVQWVLILMATALGLVLITRNSGRLKTNHASLNFGKTENRNSLSSSTSSSSSDNYGFNSRRVLFLTNPSPHPLTQRIGTLVAQGLKEFPQIEKLELAPSTPSQGAEAPDLFLRVDLVELKEEGVLSRSLKATVTASLGNAPWQSSHYIQSRSTPPLVSFTWNATLDHESTFSGVRSDRYKDAAQSIAEQLLKGVTNQLNDLSKKYAPLPELPREVYGPYQPVTDFAFLKEMKAERACSYYGLFTHNETFWKFQTTTNPVPQLQRIIEHLEGAGWKSDSSGLTNTQDYYVRFQQNDAELEIFRLRPERMDPAGLEKTQSALDLIVHYRKPFSDSEREAALEKLFTANSPIETLLPFQNSFFPKQRERYYALLEKSPATSPRGYLQLAEVYLHRQNTNAALKTLLHVKALQATLDSPGLDSEIDSLAKKISPKEKLKLEVTPELYRELGFIEITNAPQTFELERAFGQPVLLFANGERGMETFCLTIGAPQKGNYPWSMIQAREGGRSSTTSQFTLPAKGDWQETFRFGERSIKFIATPLPDGKRFKFIVQSK